jgi:hypothetical protein
MNEVCFTRIRSLLGCIRRCTWKPVVAEPLLILLVVLDLGVAHPVFSLNTPRKVEEEKHERIDVRLAPGRHLAEPEDAPFVKEPF